MAQEKAPSSCDGMAGSVLRSTDDRPWDALPAPLLGSIFSKLSIEDRFRAAFLVCHGWAGAAGDPRCWRSMLPESLPPEKAFIKSCDNLHPCSQAADSSTAISRLRTLLRLAQGRLKTIYLAPFLIYAKRNDDEILRCIAESCPELEHLSLQGSFHASEAAMCELAHKCRKLELLDFSFSPCFSSTVLEELGSCCPNLRGIKRSGDIDYEEASVLAMSLSKMALLNLAYTNLCYRGLSTIVSECNLLEYLDVSGLALAHGLDVIGRDTCGMPFKFYIAMRGIACLSTDTDMGSPDEY